MTRSRPTPPRAWTLTDLFVEKKSAPLYNSLVSLKEPGRIVSVRRQLVRLIHLTPLHPQLHRHAFWCNELDHEEFRLLVIHQDSVLWWMDVRNDSLGVRLRCYLASPATANDSAGRPHPTISNRSTDRR